MELADGDLLLMGAPTQRYWHHSLPARLGVKSERFNLTFRAIQPERLISPNPGSNPDPSSSSSSSSKAKPRSVA